MTQSNMWRCRFSHKLSRSLGEGIHAIVPFLTNEILYLKVPNLEDQCDISNSIPFHSYSAINDI